MRNAAISEVVKRPRAVPGLLPNLLPLVLALAGCATTARTASGPPPLEEVVARLDARMVGLVDELDRLGRRVRAIERRLGPGEEAPDLPGEVAAAGITGLVVDLRPLGEGFPAERSCSAWRLVTEGGEELLSSERVPGNVRTARHFFFTAQEGEVPDADLAPLLGPVRLSVTVVSATAGETEEGSVATVVVDETSARALREAPRLDAVLEAGNVVFLVRPGGE